MKSARANMRRSTKLRSSARSKSANSGLEWRETKDRRRSKVCYETRRPRGPRQACGPPGRHSQAGFLERKETRRLLFEVCRVSSLPRGPRRSLRRPACRPDLGASPRDHDGREAALPFQDENRTEGGIKMTLS